MTKVSVKKISNNITEVTCDGHTGYGVEGEDIVCSALSSIVQTALLGLLVIVGINVKTKRKDDAGFLSFSIPNDISESDRQKCNIILDTMLLGVSDLYQGFSDFIELEVK